MPNNFVPMAEQNDTPEARKSISIGAHRERDVCQQNAIAVPYVHARMGK
jgi:hypothetical protein